ncbi:transglycosylase SLT domain-containing protein [Mesobacillus zeae]|uniref:Transglycosylase SLT domain-containing protein n=1 Tax=Mesobacillus zeae TaxID=1917180 RepID=A0A398B4N4_9BACI|nr:transglycosylase SLT domain-containing protein [Mesobacillus zeae]RID85019.1 hypothetical protein D1970_10655 [Mesobacillus zeae]
MEALRSMVVELGFGIEKSPVSEINKEMDELSRKTKGMNPGVQKMQKTYDSAMGDMIKETKTFNKEVTRQMDFIRQLARTSGISAHQLANEWSSMSKDMQQSMIRNHNDMKKYRMELMNSKNDMRKLGMQMGHYQGSTNDFMKEITKLGKTHKKITDQMINSNQSMKQGFIQTVATMSAMSSQSSKISDNYDRMGGAIYKVNKPLLKVTDGLDRMARSGNAASLALQILGPNASMKALQDQVRLINQGIMRQQALLMILSIAWLGFTAVMAHSALGPDPSDVRAEQARLTKVYKDAWQDRVNEIAYFVDLFEKVSIPKVRGSDLQTALDSQLKAMQTWRNGLSSLTKKGVDEGLLKELQKAGPAAAGQIKTLDSMSRPELDKYVGTWRDKMALARTQATDELSKLKQETDNKIKDLQNSIKPLGQSWENFKSTWADALAPFVELWGFLASKMVDMGTKVGEFVQKLNEISPWITKIAGMFVYLLTTILLFLTPLAIGIGYVMGMKAAFAAAWTVIKPVVEGLAATAGTAALVTVAIIALAAGFYLLWTRSETFRNAVISGWNSIKSAAVSVWGFIRPYLMQAMAAITSFAGEKLSQLKKFWNENGAQILQAAKNFFTPIVAVVKFVMGFVWAIMQAVWPLVLGLIKSVWGNIKGVINGALNIIMGLVKIFSGLFTGDFSKMWEGIKEVFFGAIQFVWNYVNLLFVGRILGAGKLLFSGMRTIISTLWSTLKNIFFGGVKAVGGFVSKGFSAMHSSVGRIMTLIKETVTTRFSNIIDAAKALPGKIGQGIKNMSGEALKGVKSFGNKLVSGFAKVINGATSGLNWAMGKIGIDFTIPQWEPPKYAKGTGFHPGGPAILGDGGGPELYRTPGGHIGLSPGKDTLMNLPKGTEVMPFRKSMELLAAGFPAYKKGKKGQGSDGNFLSRAWQGTKNVAGDLWDGTKKVAGKVKDVGLDVWSYISNPSKLALKIFEKFGVEFPKMSGAFNQFGMGSVKFLKGKATEFLKKKMEGFSSSFAGGAAAPSQVKQWIAQALGITGTPMSWMPAMLVKAQKESGYNPRAINLWDSNFRAGHPSKGLFQTINSTFSAYKLPGMNDIYNPVHNAVAAIRYIKARYGSVFNTPGMLSMARGGGYKGYASGTDGPLKKSEWAWVGEQGPELMRLRKGTEIFNNRESRKIASGSYNPTVDSFSSGSNEYYIDYKPTVNIYGTSGNSGGKPVKQQVQEALDEHYQKLINLFDSGVVV